MNNEKLAMSNEKTYSENTVKMVCCFYKWGNIYENI